MKKIRLISFVLLFCTVFAFSCLAISPIDEAKPVTLTVDIEKKNVEMTFEIYKVASVSGFGDFVLTKDFSVIREAIPEMTVEKWDAMIAPLCQWVADHDVTPTDVGKTGSNGMVTFPICRSKLDQGLYLVIGQAVEDKGNLTTVNPMLISVPDRQEGNDWDYSVKVSAKEVLNSVTVTKIWKDKDHESARPAKVSVQLMEGTKKFGLPIELSTKNNWTYTWKDLPSTGNWSVLETKTPENYDSFIEPVPGGFTITNVYKQPTGPKLPQTGLLWWPVVALALCGTVSFTIGWIKRSRRE